LRSAKIFTQEIVLLRCSISALRLMIELRARQLSGRKDRLAMGAADLEIAILSYQAIGE